MNELDGWRFPNRHPRARAGFPNPGHAEDDVIAEQPSENWSIVMTGFTGIFWDMVEATRDAFGREDGFDASGPSVFADEYLPAEIADGLTHAEAETAAERFHMAGGTVLVVQTSELPDVRHRAREYWSQRTVGDICFTEIDGLILTLQATNARECLAHLRRADPQAAQWELERSLNHEHVGLGDPWDIAVGEGLAMVEALRLALGEAYPDKSFTILHDVGEEVTFWQSACDPPEAALDESAQVGTRDILWCATCRERVSTEPDPYRDERVPDLQWGKCCQCGSLQLIQTCEQLTYVNPNRHVPGEPPEGK